MKHLLLAIFILTVSCSHASAAERVFVVDKPLKTIATNLNENMIAQLDETTKLLREGMILMWSFEKYIFEPELSIEAWGRPKHHYYMSDITLLEPYKILGVFQRKVEIWGQPERTIVRVQIRLDTARQFRIPIIQRIKNKIVCRIECFLVNKESERLIKLANKEVIDPEPYEKPGLKESALLFFNNIVEYIRERQSMEKTTEGSTP
jgi:hypothetical protein